METMDTSVVPRSYGREGGTGRAQRIFQTVKPLCAMLLWWILVTLHLCRLRMDNPKSEP